MSIVLRKKIFLGYIIITAIVLFLTVVMINERFRFRRFEDVINKTNHARENIHKAHLYITRLATLGESVIAGMNQIITDTIISVLKQTVFCLK